MRRTQMMIAAVAMLSAFSATAAFAATKTIKIGDNWFVRDGGGAPTVTVNKNTTVKWTWVGDDEHNIRASRVPSGETKSRFRASARDSGSFSRKMTKPGTYRLYCSIHDFDDQKMVLKVRS